MKIGARIVKTGIAVTITMFICQWFHLEPAFFGAVSAVVNVQPSIFLTVKTAREQILVHVIGVGTGILFGYILGNNPLTMGLSTVLLIALYTRLNLKSGITMGIIGALFVLSANEQHFILQALMRSGVIFAGLGTAMFINVLLWPPRYMEQFKEALESSNRGSVAYFCQAVQDYVDLDQELPASRHSQGKSIHKQNEQTRILANFISREKGLLAGSQQEGWYSYASSLMAYNESISRKADRIYELLPTRLERRLQSGSPPLSPEFKAILAILEDGCRTVNRINGKLRIALLTGDCVESEEISEVYWNRLNNALEQWQPTIAGSYYLHALLDMAVTASEIRWAARDAKHLLMELRPFAAPGVSIQQKDN